MRMGSCHACKGTGKVWALDQQEMAARIAALEAEIKAYELQDGMLRKAYEDSGDAERFTWSGWLLKLVRDNAALEAIDQRCTAADGPVTPTLSEATPDELRRLYLFADRIRKETK